MDDWSGGEMTMSARLFCLLFLTGCTLSIDQYRELRAMEECRILGPECAQSYPSVAACLGDTSSVRYPIDETTYQSDKAASCIRELKEICPDTIELLTLPEPCEQVVEVTGE